MQPLVKPIRPPCFLAHYYGAIQKLCKIAFDLLLLMRKCKSRYECYNLEADRMIDAATESVIVAQPFNMVNAPPLRGSRILFTLFGALVKSANVDSNELKLLEKALVIYHA
jgi:hypothetical protein